MNPYKKFLLTTADLIFPPRCLLCRREGKFSHGLCFTCAPEISLRKDLHLLKHSYCHTCGEPFMERPENSLEEQSCEDCELYPMPFQFVRSLWRYSGTVEDLVCSYKYRDGLNLRSFFVDSLLSEINKGAFPISSRYSWSLILALPSTQESLARRGYSPVGEIAKRLALTLKLSYSPLALWTTKNYAPQATLRKEERLLNIWRKYKANPAKVRGQSVLLLDDVITTGASIAGATVALQAAGARSVDILSLARSDLFSLIRRELSEKIRGKALSGRKRDEGYDN